MNRNILFPIDAFSNPKTMVSEHTELEDGNMKTKLVALIDGKLKNYNITSSDGSAIKISALAELENCTIECADLLIEGTFSGSIKASGNIEIGESAFVAGSVTVEGGLMISPLADAVDMKITHSSAKKTAHMVETKQVGGVFQIKGANDSPSQQAA